MSEFKLPSGKYAGLTISEINERDRDYLIKYVWKTYAPNSPNFRIAKQELSKVLGLETIQMLASEKRMTYSLYTEELRQFLKKTFLSIDEMVKQGPPYLTGQLSLLKADVDAGHITEEKFRSLIESIVQKEINIQEKYFSLWSRLLYSETFLMFKEL